MRLVELTEEFYERNATVPRREKVYVNIEKLILFRRVDKNGKSMTRIDLDDGHIHVLEPTEEVRKKVRDSILLEPL